MTPSPHTHIIIHTYIKLVLIYVGIDARYGIKPILEFSTQSATMQSVVSFYHSEVSLWQHKVLLYPQLCMQGLIRSRI
jgi:hypothetical protein